MHEIRMKLEPEEPDFSDILTELEELESELKENHDENDFELTTSDLGLSDSRNQRELEYRLGQEQRAENGDEKFATGEAQNSHYFNLLRFEKAKKVKNIVSIFIWIQLGTIKRICFRITYLIVIGPSMTVIGPSSDPP